MTIKSVRQRRNAWQTVLCASALMLSVVACDNDGAAGIRIVQSAEEKAVTAFIEEAGYVCSGEPEILNFIYDQADTFGNGNFIKHYQISELKFSIQPDELSAEDRQNGVTFSGWLMFDGNTTIRQREFIRPNWTDWRQWRGLDQSSPLTQQGYQVLQVNDVWRFRNRGAFRKPAGKLLEDMFSQGGLRGRQSGLCDD